MFLTILTFLSAISISIIAAGYSIVGLATLFAGAVVPIILMGSALEVGKLVAASWLYHNWNSDVPRLLKLYLFFQINELDFFTAPNKRILICKFFIFYIIIKKKSATNMNGSSLHVNISM